MNGIIVIVVLFGLLVIALGRVSFACSATDKILEDELKRRYLIKNKHKLMRIKGLTIK